MFKRFKKLNIILQLIVIICIGIIIISLILWGIDCKFVEKKEYIDQIITKGKDNKNDIMNDPAFWRGTRVSQGTIPAELVGINLNA